MTFAQVDIPFTIVYLALLSPNYFKRKKLLKKALISDINKDTNSTIIIQYSSFKRSNYAYMLLFSYSLIIASFAYLFIGTLIEGYLFISSLMGMILIGKLFRTVFQRYIGKKTVKIVFNDQGGYISCYFNGDINVVFTNKVKFIIDKEYGGYLFEEGIDYKYDKGYYHPLIHWTSLLPNSIVYFPLSLAEREKFCRLMDNYNFTYADKN